MADLAPEDVTSVLDYLGGRQPVGRPRLSLSASGGGGAVASPVTPGFAPRVGPGRGGATPSPAGAPSESDVMTALRGVRTAADVAKFVQKFFQGAPQRGGSGTLADVLRSGAGAVGLA